MLIILQCIDFDAEQFYASSAGGGGEGYRSVEETHSCRVLLYEFYERFSQKLKQATTRML